MRSDELSIRVDVLDVLTPQLNAVVPVEGANVVLNIRSHGFPIMRHCEVHGIMKVTENDGREGVIAN